MSETNTRQARAADAMAAALGMGAVRRGDALAAADPGWHPDNLRAGVMALPSSTAEVAEIVRICAREGVALTPQGGRTGLVGGTVSRPGEIILSLERMNRIERIDADERVAVAEAGVTLEALQTAAAALALEPGIDLAARSAATLGGMASTNAGGVMAFRYGVMRHRVLGLEAVLPDGAIFSDLTRVVKVAAGYDVKQLLIGAEGTLGVVTRLAIKLEPLPRATASALFALPSFAAALEAIRLALRDDAQSLRGAEAMMGPFFRLNADAQGWRDRAIDRERTLFLLLSLGGADEPALRARLEALFGELCERHPEMGGVIAQSQRQERELWRLREDTQTVYRAYPAAPSYDVSVPISEIEGYLTRVSREVAALGRGLAPFVFGHLADGNLHIIFNHAGPFEPALDAAVEAILYRDLRALGGSFSAEHGVGSKRIGSLLAAADAGKLDAMTAIKRALDPKGIMNPGKLFRA